MASEWPGDRELAERVAEILKEGNEYDFDRVAQLAHPSSRRELRFLLGWLVRHGVVKLIFRVESPERNAGIEDFESFDDVPDRIFDRYTAREIAVTPQNLRTVYEVEAP